MALVLAGIAPASAPAAVVSVVDKLGAKGDFTDSLLGIVAGFDDAWGLIVFSVMLAVAAALAGGGGWADALTHGGRELGMGAAGRHRSRRSLGLAGRPGPRRRSDGGRGAGDGVAGRWCGPLSGGIVHPGGEWSWAPR